MAKELPDNVIEYQLRICRAIDFINAHLAECPSVTEIARAAPFSSFHFQRLFRAVVGETVAEFTRRLRLETAARLLRYRDGGDITGLAFELGFSSSQNFAKAFKKHFGVSASRYRDEVRDDVESDSPNVPAYDQDRIRATMQSNANHSKLAVPSVEVRNVPGFRVAYRRHFGSYDEPGVQGVFDDLVRWAKPRGFDLLDRYIGIPWDDSDVTAEDKCRFDACVVVPGDGRLDGGINSQMIPPGRYAIQRCAVVANDFDLPWTRLMRDWLPGSGFQPADGPRFEKYLTDGSRDPEGRWQMETFLPVKPL